jgi:outer membrane protein assembly factor BamB
MIRVRALMLAGGLVAALAATPIPATAAGTAWTTAHLDPARSGNDLNDTGLSGSVTPSWTSPQLDGRIYGEPLYLNGTIYVATQGNSVYAIDGNDGHVIWSAASILPPVPLSEVHAETGTSSGCGNIDPLGVTGTPVIDPSLGGAGTLFAAAETYQPGVANSIEHRLLRVDLSSHAVTSRNIDPVATGFTDGTTRGLEQARGALSLDGGEVAVPYGGLIGDCGGYHGFAVSSLEDLSGPANTFEADPGHHGGGIWAASGAAVDASGNLYVATGNGYEPSGSSNYDMSDGVIKLAATMGQPNRTNTTQFFAPDVWSSDNSADKDLGSLTPTIVPRSGQSPLIFQTGKQNIGFLLDSANLGGIGGQLFPPLATEATTGHVCDGAAKGGTSYANGLLYVPCSEGIRALSVNTSAPSFARAWQGPADAIGPPIIAGGRVWVHGSGRIYGLNASTGATEVTLNNVSTPYNFGSPSAGGDHLFFASGSSVVAFGGSAPSPPPPPPPTARWAGWYPLGGSASGRVAMGTNSDGRLEGFWRGTDGTVRHLWQNSPGGGWTQDYGLGGAPAGDPAVATNRDGRLEAFVVGTDGQLWHAWQVAPSSFWTSWYPLGGSFSGRPAVLTNSDGRMEAFIRGTDNAIWHVWQNSPGGGWVSPFPLGGSATADPATGVNADGRLEVFARRADQALWHSWQVAPGSAWGSWVSLGGTTAGSPAVAANADGRLEAFARGADGALWHTWQTAPNGNWYPFTSLGGTFSSDPGVGVNADRRLEAFILDGSGQVTHTWQKWAGGLWVGFATLGGFTAASPPGIGTNADGRLELLARGTDNTIWHAWQTVANG